MEQGNINHSLKNEASLDVIDVDHVYHGVIAILLLFLGVAKYFHVEKNVAQSGNAQSPQREHLISVKIWN